MMSSSCHCVTPPSRAPSAAAPRHPRNRESGGVRLSFICLAAVVLLLGLSWPLEGNAGGRNAVHHGVLGVLVVTARESPPNLVHGEHANVNKGTTTTTTTTVGDADNQEGVFANDTESAAEAIVGNMQLVRDDAEAGERDARRAASASLAAVMVDGREGEDNQLEPFSDGSDAVESDLANFIEQDPLLKPEALTADDLAAAGGADAPAEARLPHSARDAAAMQNVNNANNFGGDIRAGAAAATAAGASREKEVEEVRAERSEVSPSAPSTLRDAGAHDYAATSSRSTRRRTTREPLHVFHDDCDMASDDVGALDATTSSENEQHHHHHHHSYSYHNEAAFSPYHEPKTAGASRFEDGDVDSAGGGWYAASSQQEAMGDQVVGHYTDTSHVPSALHGEDEVVDGDGYMVAGTGDKAGDDGPGLHTAELEEDKDVAARAYLSSRHTHVPAASGWFSPPSMTTTSSSSVQVGAASSGSGAQPSRFADAPMDTVADSNMRTSVLNVGMAVRDGLTFDMKREVQARWREYRSSYPTLRELIRQLVTAYKEEQQVKRACLSWIAAKQRQANSFAHTTCCNSSSSCASRSSSSGGVKGKPLPENITEAECAASLPTLGTSLDWVRYLPYVPIYPIDEALKHLEHEKDDDILLALFYAPDLFNTYNYIQWMGLMVKATCALLRAGALDPITHIREDDYVPDVDNSTSQQPRTAAATNRSVFCANLVLPSMNGVLRPDDLQRLRTNTVRIAIIDGYYPLRNVTRNLWEHMGTDTYMVNEDEWGAATAAAGDKDDDNSEGRTGHTCASGGKVDGSHQASAEQNSTDTQPNNHATTTAAKTDSAFCADHLPISAMMQRSSEDWGPVFIEQRNALLRLLAREGGLFKDVQEALQPLSRPWRGGYARAAHHRSSVGSALDVLSEEQQKETHRPRRDASDVRAHTMEGWREAQAHSDEHARERHAHHVQEEAEGQLRHHYLCHQGDTNPNSTTVSSSAFGGSNTSDFSEGGCANAEQTLQLREGPPAGAEPTLHAVDAGDDSNDDNNDRIHFLARYILQNTDDLIVTRPQMLLEVLQRSFDRIRQREQRLVEKIFSWSQIMKYRVHVNVSAQRIDEFSSDHVCEVRYQVYLNSPNAYRGTGASEDAKEGGAGRADAGQSSGNVPSSRLGLNPTFWTGTPRSMADDAGDDYDIDELGSKASCYYYQQLRQFRTTAALGSVSGLRRRAKRHNAILASTPAKTSPTHLRKKKPRSSRTRKSLEEEEDEYDPQGYSYEGRLVVPRRQPAVELNRNPVDIWSDDAAAEQVRQLRQSRRAKLSGAASSREGGGEEDDQEEEEVDVTAEARRHLPQHPPDDAAMPRYRRPHVDMSVTEEADSAAGDSESAGRYGSADDEAEGEEDSEEEEEEEEEEEDLDAFFDEVLSRRDELEEFHEMHVRYVDGMDELAIEENPAVAASSTTQTSQADNKARRKDGAPMKEDASAGAPADSVVGASDTPPGTTMPGPRGVPGASVNSLRLLGTAARRNYLLRQNPPVLLFPRKQGSRPYVFPQTLLEMVHLSFADAHGQLPPREHAQRLRQRWGCEGPPPSSSSPAGGSADCSSSPPLVSSNMTGSNNAPRGAGTPSSCGFPCRVSGSQNSSNASDETNSNADPSAASTAAAHDIDSAATTTTTSSAQSSSTSTMSPPTPSTYRVVSALDNPFSRIGVEHLHYDFVICGPSSPLAVLQLLVEEARRVSTPGELESRSHREAIYRLQHRQWLEARQRRAAQAAEKQAGSKQTSQTVEAGQARAVVVEGEGSGGAAYRLPLQGAVNRTDNSTSKQAVSPRSTAEAAPTADVNHRKYGHYATPWGERLLENTAKDLKTYLVGGQAATEKGDAVSSQEGGGAGGAPSQNNNIKRSDGGSDAKPVKEAGKVDNRVGVAGASLAGGLAADEDQEYFFEHDVSFRLDPDRFVESAPLTLHFFLRTPTHVVETEIIEPLREHVQVLRQRLIEDILADVFQYGRCQISGSRFVQLLRHSVDAPYVNGTRVTLPSQGEVPAAAAATANTTGTDAAGQPGSQGKTAPPPPPPLPYAYTEEGLPQLRCLRNSAAMWVWRLASEMQAQEIQRAFSNHSEAEVESTRPRTRGDARANIIGEEDAGPPQRPFPLPRDPASFLELLHMPYDTTIDLEALIEMYEGKQVFSDTVPLYNSRFNPLFYSSEWSAETAAKVAALSEEELARLREQRHTYERLFFMQVAYQELMKRSGLDVTESFFQLLTIDREAAMRVSPDDPSKVVHRTLPSSLRSSAMLPVPDSEPVRPRACLGSFNNSYMAITYLFFNSTAERYYRNHPLNRRRVRLMQRLDEAVRLSRQARLILLTASEEDYRTQYVDSIIQDAARRFFIIRQINRNRDTALRELEQRQQLLQQQQGRPFSTKRVDAKDVVHSVDGDALVFSETANGRRLLSSADRLKASHGESSTTADAATSTTADGPKSAGTVGTDGPAASLSDSGDDEEQQLGLYESYAHLSPFQFNTINYDFDTSDDLLSRHAKTKESARVHRTEERPSTKVTRFPSLTYEATKNRQERTHGSLSPSSAASCDETGRCLSLTNCSATSLDGRADFCSSAEEHGCNHSTAATQLAHYLQDSRAGASWAGEGASSAQRQHSGRAGGAASSVSSSYNSYPSRGSSSGGEGAKKWAEGRSIMEEMALLGEEMWRGQDQHGERHSNNNNNNNNNNNRKHQNSDSSADVPSGRVVFSKTQEQEPNKKARGSRWRSWFSRWRHASDNTAQAQQSHATSALAGGRKGGGDSTQQQQQQNTHATGGESAKPSRAHFGVWERHPLKLEEEEEEDEEVEYGGVLRRQRNDDNDNDDGFVEPEEFEQGNDDDGTDMSHVITGEKTEYEEGLPFPWRHGELPKQELRRRLEEHQRHVRELKRRLIDVRLRWASALWNERERPGGATLSAPSSQQPQPQQHEGTSQPLSDEHDHKKKDK